jgi:hypothetical protein
VSFKQKIENVYFVEGLDDVGQVDPGLAVGRHLVENVVTEQLHHVPVARLCPLQVTNHALNLRKLGNAHFIL